MEEIVLRIPLQICLLARGGQGGVIFTTELLGDKGGSLLARLIGIQRVLT